MTAAKVYSAAFQESPDASIILKPDAPAFTIVDVNEAYLGFVNKGREDLIGHGFFDVFPSDDPRQDNPGWRKIFDEVLRTKHRVTFPVKKCEPIASVAHSGDIKYLQASNIPVLGEEGRLEYIVRTLKDRTASATHRSYLDKTLHAANIGTWQLHLPDQALTCSRSLVEIFEMGAGEAPDMDTFRNFFEDEESRNHIRNAVEDVIENGSTFCDTLAVITEKGNKKWLLITCSRAYLKEDGDALLYGIMQDVTESKSLAEMDRLEKHILELNEKQELPLSEILSEYLGGMESLCPNMYGSIHKIQDGRLLRWAAPSLPESYLNAINHHPIGENMGSCGTAAYLKRPVYIDDIAHAPEWSQYAHLPLALEFRACWSYPVIDSDDNVIAVLGMYYKGIRKPGGKELIVIERAVKLLQLILENALRADQLLKASETMKQAQALARFGNWQWNRETNQVDWSDVLYDIYGVDPKVHQPSFDNYLAAVHEEDRQKIINTMRRIEQTGEEIVFEERIVRPDGEIRYLKSWARLMSNRDGSPSRMIGACLDITEIRMVETDLKNLYARQELYLRQIIDSEKRYSDLFHLSPQPIWVCDPDTNKIIDVNAAAVALYGYTHSEFTALSVADIASACILPEEQEPAALPRSRTGLFSKDVILHKKKNGEVIYVIVLGKRIELGGQISEVMIIQDVTEKLNYVQAIELQNRKLQEIAWMQSHLVRAPLARIMALADLIQNVPASGMEIGDLLTAIDRSATELDKVLRPIIDRAEQIEFN